MRYNQLEYFSVANGSGIRTVLWVQGCDHHCYGCQNPQTWDFREGNEFTEKTVAKIIKSLKSPSIKGITFSGGDPLNPKNVEEITKLAKLVRETYPEKSIWCYTGYNWSDVDKFEIMGYLDVLVDGKFDLQKRNLALPYCGSENQHVIDVQKSLASGEMVAIPSRTSL